MSLSSEAAVDVGVVANCFFCGEYGRRSVMDCAYGSPGLLLACSRRDGLVARTQRSMAQTAAANIEYHVDACFGVWASSRTAMRGLLCGILFRYQLCCCLDLESPLEGINIDVLEALGFVVALALIAPGAGGGAQPVDAYLHSGR